MSSSLFVLSFIITILVVGSLLTGSSTTPLLFVDAQALRITPKAEGGESAITAVLITKDLFHTGNTTLNEWMPFRFTNLQVANDPSNLIFVMDNFQSAQPFKYNEIWEFTTEESTVIKSWLKSLPKIRNYLHVAFITKWNSNGRFTVDPTSSDRPWRFEYSSLLPYGWNRTNDERCDLIGIFKKMATSVSNLPTDCTNVMVPDMKARARDYPYCLLPIAVSAMLLWGACYGPNAATTGRVAMTNFYCSDGAPAVDNIMCPYVKPWLASGDATAPMVIRLGSDGLPEAGRADQQPQPPASSAGKQLQQGVFVFSIFIALISISIYLFL